MGNGDRTAGRPQESVHRQHRAAQSACCLRRSGWKECADAAALLLCSRVQTCQVLSSAVGGAGALCYLFVRHNNYTPPTFTRVVQLAVSIGTHSSRSALLTPALTSAHRILSAVYLRQMQAGTPTPPTSAAGLPLTGPLLASSSPPASRSLPPNTVVAPPRPAAAPSRFRSMYNVVRVPARFYAINLLVGAAVMGAGTSVGQRLLCRSPSKPPIKQAKME